MEVVNDFATATRGGYESFPLVSIRERRSVYFRAQVFHFSRVHAGGGGERFGLTLVFDPRSLFIDESRLIRTDDVLLRGVVELVRCD